jgi:hypothetical protein
MEAVAGVERVGQSFGFEQVQRDAADVLAPDRRRDGVAVEVDVDVHSPAHETGGRRIDRLNRSPAGRRRRCLQEVAESVEQPTPTSGIPSSAAAFRWSLAARRGRRVDRSSSDANSIEK